jgi:hypothetical protein
LYLKHRKCTCKITRTIKYTSIPSSFCALNFTLPAFRLKHEVAHSTQSLSRPGVVRAYKGLTVHWYGVASASHRVIELYLPLTARSNLVDCSGMFEVSVSGFTLVYKENLSGKLTYKLDQVWTADPEYAFGLFSPARMGFDMKSYFQKKTGLKILFP